MGNFASPATSENSLRFTDSSGVPLETFNLAVGTFNGGLSIGEIKAGFQTLGQKTFDSSDFARNRGFFSSSFASLEITNSPQDGSLIYVAVFREDSIQDAEGVIFLRTNASFIMENPAIVIGNPLALGASVTAFIHDSDILVGNFTTVDTSRSHLINPE